VHFKIKEGEWERIP
jgi:hypothetical protein